MLEGTVDIGGHPVPKKALAALGAAIVGLLLFVAWRRSQAASQTGQSSFSLGGSPGGSGPGNGSGGGSGGGGGGVVTPPGRGAPPGQGPLPAPIIPPGHPVIPSPAPFPTPAPSPVPGSHTARTDFRTGPAQGGYTYAGTDINNNAALYRGPDGIVRSYDPTHPPIDDGSLVHSGGSPASGYLPVEPYPGYNNNGGA